MRIAVTGSSGLIGSSLVEVLEAEGHEVVRLVRSKAPGAREVAWDPAAGSIDAAALEGVSGAVHLAGEPIGSKRWTPGQKQKILDSRVQGTRFLATTLAALDHPPEVLVSGSAIGYYGLRGDQVLTERDDPGSGFLADVTQQWEAATFPAEKAGIRTVHLRTGIVFASRGGALAKLLPLFRLGLGGKLGRGDQWWSWITLEDEIRLIVHLLAADVSGPVNSTAPEPATNEDVTRALGRAFHRPTVLSVPKFALGLAMGRELTEQVILAGQRVLPAVAQDSGFEFQHPDLDGALRHVLST